MTQDLLAAPASAPGTEDPGGFEVRTSYEQDLEHIAEIAIRGSVVIYTVDTRGLDITFPTAADSFRGTGAWSPSPARGPGSPSRQVGQMISARSATLFNDRQGAEIIARETGGLAIRDSNDFDLKRVSEDQQGYYLIGFRPADETFDRKFHHLTDPDSAEKRGTKFPTTSTNVSRGEKARVADEEPGAVPAVRRFRQGASLMFAYAVYKAQLDSTTHLPQLTSQTRIFRDGELIYTGEILPLAAAGQPDLLRITGGSRIQLGSDFPVGEYILQIVVSDNLAKEKVRTLSQWIDFEVAHY